LPGIFTKKELGIDSEYSLLNGIGTLQHKHSAPLLTNTRKLSQLNHQQQNGCRGGGRIGLNRTGSNCLEIINGNMANGHQPHVRRLPKIEVNKNAKHLTHNLPY